jgi:hypothetical protein
MPLDLRPIFAIMSLGLVAIAIMLWLTRVGGPFDRPEPSHVGKGSLIFLLLVYAVAAASFLLELADSIKMRESATPALVAVVGGAGAAWLLSRLDGRWTWPPSVPVRVIIVGRLFAFIVLFFALEWYSNSYGDAILPGAMIGFGIVAIPDMVNGYLKERRASTEA